jgi:hypothetical protein
MLAKGKPYISHDDISPTAYVTLLFDVDLMILSHTYHCNDPSDKAVLAYLPFLLDHYITKRKVLPRPKCAPFNLVSVQYMSWEVSILFS